MYCVFPRTRVIPVASPLHFSHSAAGALPADTVFIAVCCQKASRISPCRASHEFSVARSRNRRFRALAHREGANVSAARFSRCGGSTHSDDGTAHHGLRLLALNPNFQLLAIEAEHKEPDGRRKISVLSIGIDVGE